MSLAAQVIISVGLGTRAKIGFDCSPVVIMMLVLVLVLTTTRRDDDDARMTTFTIVRRVG